MSRVTQTRVVPRGSVKASQSRGAVLETMDRGSRQSLGEPAGHAGAAVDRGPLTGCPHVLEALLEVVALKRFVCGPCVQPQPFCGVSISAITCPIKESPPE